MAGTITHKWNGTVLTITSDSGTSSCDLKGAKGDMGARGVQGAAGVLVDPTGTVLAPADNYYLKEEVEDLITEAKAEINTDLDALETTVTNGSIEFNNKIDTQNKRITNLEHWLAPRYFETDNTVAYCKDVPEGALPYAEVEKVGGMTRKCNNLIPFPYLETTRSSNGLTFTVNADGSISITGTATANTALYLVGENSAQRKPIKAGTYTASATGDSKIEFIIGIAGDKEYNASYYGSKVTITVGSDTTYYAKLRILSGVTVNSTVYPMLNAGSTALPYEPYFEGLRDSKVTEVKSIGTNLLPIADKTLTIKGCTVSVNNGNITITGTANANGGRLVPISTVTLEAGTYCFSGGSEAYLSNKADESSITVGNNRPFTLDKKTTLIFGFNFQSGVTYSKTFNAWITKGSTALPYAPYVENTLAIPTAVQALDGWGQGVNSDYYNYVSWQPNDFLKTYTKMVEKVVLDGSSDETYKINSGYTGTLYNCFVINLGAGKWGKSASAGLCSQCEVVTNATTLEQDAPYAFFGNVSYGQFFFKVLKTEAADVEALKTFLAANPMEVVYIKAAPVVTDISNLLPDDNFIAVEANGSVTMVNEYAQAVPSAVTYQFKEGAQ